MSEVICYVEEPGLSIRVRSFAVSDLDSLLLLNDVPDSDTSPDPDLNGTL